MSTNSQLKQEVITNISQNGPNDRITSQRVRTSLNEIIDEISLRGVKQVAATSDLSTLDSTETKIVFVTGNDCLYKAVNSGTIDNIEIFQGANGTFWKLVFDVNIIYLAGTDFLGDGHTILTAYTLRLKTLNGQSIKGDGNLQLAFALGSLSDVQVTAPANGQVLKWNGTAWVNGADNAGGGGSQSPLEQNVDGAFFDMTNLAKLEVSKQTLAGQVFATLDPVHTGTNTALSNGNRTATTNGNGFTFSRSNQSFNIANANIYVECVIGTYHASLKIGIASASEDVNNYLGFGTDGYSISGDGTLFNNATNSTPGQYNGTNPLTAGTVVGIKVNNGNVEYIINGVSRGVAFTGLTGTFHFAFGGGFGVTSGTYNFGATTFTHPQAGTTGLFTANVVVNKVFTADNAGIDLHGLLKLNGVSGNNGQVIKSRGLQNPEWANNTEWNIGTISTVNNTPVNIPLFTMAAGECGIIEVNLVSVSGDGGSFVFGSKKVAVHSTDGVVVVFQTVQNTVPTALIGAFTTAGWTIGANGADVLVTVTGETGANIDWKIDWKYTQINAAL